MFTFIKTRFTPGILERLSAIDRYFCLHPERKGEDVFYQIAAASRSDISSYQQYQSKALQMIDGINEKYGQFTLVLDRTNQPQSEVVKLYKAADVMLITPLADGMNLVGGETD